MSYDELELDRMGDRRTATFFCISDTDSTYNFLVALAFSQMFNLLCERADNVHGGRLPHHVRVLWDEAANTGQVPNLEKLVAVIRSREISLCLLYQQLAQCKAIYDKNAETILGNMDSVLFLGGREASTIKEISENWLGKATISMQTEGRSRGQSESYSQNTQRLGRELMTPSELATMPGDRCKFPILRPQGNQWKLNRNCVLSLCGMGVPMGLQYSVTAIGSIILQAAVNSLGTLSVAAVAAASKLTLIFCCPFDALGSSIATYAGQNVGAGRYDRVRKGVVSCMILGSIYAVLAVILFYFCGGALTTLFADPGSTLLIAQSRQFLICNALFYIPLTGVNVYRFCIQGMGYSPIAILAGLFEMAARASIGFLLVPAVGYIAVCFASPAAWIAADCFLVPMYLHLLRKGERQQKKRTA